MEKAQQFLLEVLLPLLKQSVKAIPLERVVRVVQVPDLWKFQRSAVSLLLLLVVAFDWAHQGRFQKGLVSQEEVA